MTPTVELNALAMKRGEPAIYRLVEYPHGATYQPQQTLTFRRPYGVSLALRFNFPLAWCILINIPSTIFIIF